MSISLLKKSIAILEDVPDKHEQKVNKFKTDLPHKKQRGRILAIDMRSKSKQYVQVYSKEAVKHKYLNAESTATEDNLRKLMKFSNPSSNKNLSEEIIKRAQSQHYVIPEEKSKAEQTSAFTEADFKAFEEEYFCV